MKVLILGASGMLGSAVFRVLNAKQFNTVGAFRDESLLQYMGPVNKDAVICNLNVLDDVALVRLLEKNRPDVVINCVGLIKQMSGVDDPLTVLPINSIFPHKLSGLCNLLNARLIHISTDCVFDGKKGFYNEGEISNATDLYGKSKYIGEIVSSKNAITLRTSIIGHGLKPNSSLVDWFLAQQDKVNGYSRAIFSGLPTVELASFIASYVIPNKNLHGLYHVSAEPISKFNLLKLIADQYGKGVEILENDNLEIDRSLESSKLYNAVKYKPVPWPELISKMHSDYLNGK